MCYLSWPLQLAATSGKQGDKDHIDKMERNTARKIHEVRLEMFINIVWIINWHDVTEWGLTSVKRLHEWVHHTLSVMTERRTKRSLIKVIYLWPKTSWIGTPYTQFYEKTAHEHARFSRSYIFVQISDSLAHNRYGDSWCPLLGIVPPCSSILITRGSLFSPGSITWDANGKSHP